MTYHPIDNPPPTVPIVVGQTYEFVSEVEQVELPRADRLCQRTGQTVTVLSQSEDVDEECSPLYSVRFEDGFEASEWEEELSGWDKGLRQYYLPDGTWAGDQSDHPNGEAA